MVVLGGIFSFGLLTSGPASTSSCLTSSQKFSGIQRRFSSRFPVRVPWPAALASPKPFSSRQVSGFMLPCRGSARSPLLRALLIPTG